MYSTVYRTFLSAIMADSLLHVVAAVATGYSKLSFYCRLLQGPLGIELYGTYDMESSCTGTQIC